ncbi:TetR/AcrR family transcriptional regulator [Pseudomonas sp. N040]|uniref:TetR/AcrR family transcriptional regulator n=1 Tax=Pseudomonas sp. N040 TaxID=2785325 RepID=UPI0018A2E431|nr:TetR/AcrR family transcriptional regulator [Pseudomonas sp. N040]MBF7729652.1 TetR family transcriptional regulator [Pseudomonas sp. N040]MBW7013294.1 TetR family transcriptional regulator [Pseudomonas sp. N040]
MNQPRAPGRPTGDAQLQRQRLLDAALASFARHGIAASSLRSIADQAGVTPALVNYYFGNKQRLVETVFEERLAPLLANVANALHGSEDDPRQLVRRLVCALNATLSQHPWLPPLWVREVLCEGGALRELWATRIGPMIPARLAAYFAAAQARQALNAELNPRLLVVSLFGLVMLPHAAASLLHGIFPDLDNRAAALSEHTLALLERGMETSHAD